MRRRISINTAKNIMSIFWPDFKEANGLVLLSWEYPVSDDLSNHMDQTGIEAFCNHTHMSVLFYHHAGRTPTSEEDDLFFNYEHPDFKELCDLGRRIASIWFLKLKQDFPQYRFRVYYTQYDDPIVRFHRVRDDEPNWLDEEDWQEDIKSESIVILDTGKV